jgi:hypothetical protein
VIETQRLGFGTGRTLANLQPRNAAQENLEDDTCGGGSTLASRPVDRVLTFILPPLPVVILGLGIIGVAMVAIRRLQTGPSQL